MAVTKVAIRGHVLGPDGVAPTSGKLKVRLNQHGSTLDGAESVRVGGEIEVALSTGGVLPTAGTVLDLIPNDVITPSGTYYLAEYVLALPSGRRWTRVEKWQFTSADLTLDIGAVPQIDEASGATWTLHEAVQASVLASATASASAAATSAADAASAATTAVTADGSTTARLPRTRWARPINVLDEGAVGDGVTDDTAAILRAIARAPTVMMVDLGGASKPSISSRIHFPTPAVGYRITAQSILAANKSLRFTGESMTAVRLILDSADDYIFRLATGTGRSVSFEGLWFDQGGIYYETNVRTYHRISECRFSRAPAWAVRAAGAGIVNVRLDRCIITNNAGGIAVEDEQCDLWSIEKCSIGVNTGVDLYVATSGLTCIDNNFESKAVGSEANPYIHIARGTSLSPGLQLVFDKNRFGNEVAHPTSAIVIGPLAGPYVGQPQDGYSTSPIWFTNNTFKGATGNVPSDTNARDAILLNMPTRGLQVRGNSFWNFKHLVNEAFGATLGGTRGAYGNVWEPNTYMGNPTVAAFTKGGIGWEIRDPIIEHLHLPAHRSPVGQPRNLFPSTEVTTGWGIDAGLSVAKDAVGPDGVAGSAFTITRTATGSQRVYKATAQAAPSGVVTFPIWLKAGTVNSVRFGVLSNTNLWRVAPDTSTKLAAVWTKHVVTVRCADPAETLTFYVYHDADAASAGTILLAFPSAVEGAVDEPYLSNPTAQRAARPFQSLVLGDKVVGYGTAAPASGRYEVGDLWVNTAPATDGAIGWRCTTAGSPGTWETIRQGPIRGRTVITQSGAGTIAINAALGDYFEVVITDGTGFGVGSPTNPTLNQEITIRLKNTSGVANTHSFGGSYKLAAWTSPANGFSRSIRFRYDGTVWVEQNRTTVDVPN